jgi:hypothetical protein
MYGTTEVQRAEELLWDAVRVLYGPSAGPKVEAAAAVVEALAAYRTAVEEHASRRSGDAVLWEGSARR